jgi:hypothetical protein
MPWADWHPTRSVHRDAAGSYSATADRGSMKAGANAVVDDLHPGHVSRAGERRIDGPPVPALPLERHVIRPIVPDERRPWRERLLDADGRRPWLVVDAHQFGRVLGLGQGLGHEEHDRLAGIARRLSSQGKLLGLGRHCPVRAADVEGRGAREGGNRSDDLALDVGRRQDQPHARSGESRGGVDGPDASVGVGTPHDHAVELPGQRDVIREAGGAGEE